MAIDTEKLERAVLDYLWSEGCSCCSHASNHQDALARIGRLFGWPEFEGEPEYTPDWYTRRAELKVEDIAANHVREQSNG